VTEETGDLARRPYMVRMNPCTSARPTSGAPATSWQTLQREAHTRFGIARFRPGQREIIESVLAGRDVVGIMATGAGKSLCYQLPALTLPHATVVVSPLISLMQDQQEKLASVDVHAAKLDSTLSRSQEREVVQQIGGGAHPLVYLTPERLEDPSCIDLLRQAGVSLLVVDEAHCVSQWGHDFRPAYLNLREAARALGRPPVLALTATATPEVLEDIRRQLALEEPVIVNTGIDRVNLWFEVFRTLNDEMKRERVREILRAHRDIPGTGILYTATVKEADALWRWLSVEEGVRAARYHARRPNGERARTQQEFMAGEHDVIVATKAFGMGIDKPDIRFVIHYSFPDSLESYYQEVGRAGRDGKPARVTLLYRLEDKRVQSYFLGGKYPSREQSRQVFEAIGRMSDAGEDRGVTLKALIEACGLPERKVKVVVALLDAAGVIVRGRRLRRLRDFASAEEMEAFLVAYEQRHHGDHERLQTMMRYAEQPECRLAFLRAYFAEGESTSAACNHCDNCLRTADSTATVAEEMVAAAVMKPEHPAA